MPTILHVNSSPRGGDSQSGQLAHVLLDHVVGSVASATVDVLNLFDDGLPAFGAPSASAKYAAFAGTPMNSAAAEAWAQARAVFDRFAAADACVFSVPMWNAGVPYVLKQWIDIVTQPGWAFTFDPSAGYRGLVTGKPAAVVYASGVYTTGRGLEFGADFCSSFFNDWLRFVGFTRVFEARYPANALSTDPAADFQNASRELGGMAIRFSTALVQSSCDEEAA